MKIHNKQELKKCLKHLFGSTGRVIALTGGAPSLGFPSAVRLTALSGSPYSAFDPEDTALLAAATHMELTVSDPQRLEEGLSAYSQEGFARAVLDELKAEAILCRGMEEAAADDRLIPVPILRGEAYAEADDRDFGPDYRSISRRLCEQLPRGGWVSADLKDPAFICRALLPACKETGCGLWLQAENETELSEALALAGVTSEVRFLLGAAEALETSLIESAAGLEHVTALVGGSGDLERALQHLGSRFLPLVFSEEDAFLLLGAQLMQCQALSEALMKAYLTQARLGIRLDSKRVENDVKRLFGDGLVCYNESEPDWEDKSNESDFYD